MFLLKMRILGDSLQVVMLPLKKVMPSTGLEKTL